MARVVFEMVWILYQRFCNSMLFCCLSWTLVKDILKLFRVLWCWFLPIQCCRYPLWPLLPLQPCSLALKDFSRFSSSFHMLHMLNNQ